MTDPPQSHLRLETYEDRILVLELLCAVNRQKIDGDLWLQMNPEKAKRLFEILPKKNPRGRA